MFGCGTREFLISDLNVRQKKSTETVDLSRENLNVIFQQ